MIETKITLNSNILSLSIPANMVGKQLKIIAFIEEEEAEVIDRISNELSVNEDTVYIPQWQKDLVLAEQKRIKEDFSLLVNWETVKKEMDTETK